MKIIKTVFVALEFANRRMRGSPEPVSPRREAVLISPVSNCPPVPFPTPALSS